MSNNDGDGDIHFCKEGFVRTHILGPWDASIETTSANLILPNSSCKVSRSYEMRHKKALHKRKLPLRLLSIMSEQIPPLCVLCGYRPIVVNVYCLFESAVLHSQSLSLYLADTAFSVTNAELYTIDSRLSNVCNTRAWRVAKINEAVAIQNIFPFRNKIHQPTRQTQACCN